MGYLHIDNLYKNNTIQLFNECYALEKIHGTSANIKWKDKKVIFFSGGASYHEFVKIFDEEKLSKVFDEIFEFSNVTIFGEAYGGKMQAMRATYGDKLKFVAFDVMIDDAWADVPNAENIVKKFDLEFVDYAKIKTDIEAINAERDKDSTQAIRNGCGPGHKREGVVLRPLIECRKNNGSRIISKHKRDEFMETKTPRVVDPNKLKLLEKVNDITEEWVTPMRLNHVLDKIENKTMENVKNIILAMVEDVYREGKGEIVESKELQKAIGAKTVKLFKIYLQSTLA